MTDVIPDHDLTPVEPDHPSDELMRDLEVASSTKRYTDAQLFEYTLSVMLNENLSIPAQNCAAHTEAVDLLKEMVG